MLRRIEVDGGGGWLRSDGSGLNSLAAPLALRKASQA